MKTSLPLLLGLGALSLGACATAPEYSGPPPASGADRHSIQVQQTGERIDIPVEAGDVALDERARTRLQLFADAYLRAGHGALVMSSPSGGDNADAAALVAQEARLTLAVAGVPYSAIAGSTYDATGVSGAPIVLTFTRYEAQAPDCRPLWEQDLAHQSDNRPWESFGCATQANLAAMIEDPRDLLQPRGEDPRDSGRRGVVMDAYREGQQTHATRTADERVAISNAVE